MPSSYLVTGGSGFCGFEIVKRLVSMGHRVRVLDIDPLPESCPGVEFVAADIRDAEQVKRACLGMDFVIHTVAKVPISKAGKDFRSINAGGTENILRGALDAGVKKVVHFSSSAVQFSEKNPVSEDAPYHPVGLYAKSKMEAEKICFEYLKKGLAIDILRPRTVIGLGRLGIFDILFDWIADGKSIYIIGKGDNRIQFIHSEDLARCAILASEQPQSHIFNVGGKSFGTLREDLEALIRHAGTKSKVKSLPVGLTIGCLATLDALRLSPLASWHYMTYHKDFYFTNEKAKKILGWEPKLGNQETLILAYDGYIQERSKGCSRYGQSHRKGLKQGILWLLKRMSGS